MQDKILEINNLKVTFDNKLILKNINLNIWKEMLLSLSQN